MSNNNFLIIENGNEKNFSVVFGDIYGSLEKIATFNDKKMAEFFMEMCRLIQEITEKEKK